MTIEKNMTATLAACDPAFIILTTIDADGFD
jgi:hypothetical protein